MSIEYFKGDGSFIRNHYAIFEEGKGGQKPNPIALERGYESGYSLLGQVSYHGNSSFSKLIHYLEVIQKKEARKEKEFLNKKLIQLQKKLPEEYYAQINKATVSENYSAALTLLQNYKKDLNDLRRELESPHFSFQKTNSFWATSFANYLESELGRYLTVNGDKIVSTGVNISIDQLVDNYLNEWLGANNGIIAYGLENERQKYIDQLTNVFKKKGIIPEKWDSSQNLFTNRQRKDYTALSKGMRRRKKGETRSIKVIGEQLGQGVMNGIGMEIQAGVHAANTGSTAIMTGRFERDILSILNKEYKNRVSQKGDLLTFDIFEGEYDLDSIVRKIFDDKPDINLEQLKEEITKVIPDLEIFEVSQNIKGYKSKMDLSIEQEGSFDNRLANLKKMGDNNFFNKLVFILVNTTDSCIFDKRLDEVGNYVAAAFAAWMWDDYDEIYNLKEPKTNFTKLHIFNSGGAYFTASTLMKATLEELKNNYDENGMTKRNVSSLIKVDIKPGSYSDREYLELVDRYKVSSVSAQEDLKLRWDAVRAAALERGTMSISIRQNELEKLLGNLEAIIREV